MIVTANGHSLLIYMVWCKPNAQLEAELFMCAGHTKIIATSY